MKPLNLALVAILGAVGAAGACSGDNGSSTSKTTTTTSSGTPGGAGGSGGGGDTGGAGGGAGGGSSELCKGSSITPQELIDLAPQIVCPKYLGCCPKGFMIGNMSFTNDTCLTNFKAFMSNQYGGVEANPNQDWNGVAAAQCCQAVEKRAAMDTCADPGIFGSSPPAPACDDIIIGLVMEGKACKDGECVDKTRCDFQTMVCVSTAAVGESCAMKSCASGLYCDAAMMCQTPKPVGATCADSSECESQDCDNGECAPGAPYTAVCIP